MTAAAETATAHTTNPRQGCRNSGRANNELMAITSTCRPYLDKRATEGRAPGGGADGRSEQLPRDHPGVGTAASVNSCELVHHGPVEAFLASTRNPLGTAI